MYDTSTIWSIEPRRFQGFVARVYRRDGAGPETLAASRFPSGQGVAVVPVRGVILKDAGWLEAFGAFSLRKMEDALLAASADPSVQKIALVIESPGGSVDGVKEAADIIRQTSRTKPVIAIVDGIAASAAYYLASQATEIVAGPMDEVGSIGVRVMMYDFSKMFADAGVVPVLIDTGEFKSIGAMGMPITEAQQAEIRKLVDAFFEDFKSAVRKGRKMSEEQVEKVADGRVFLAKEAMKLGLVDRIKPSRDAVAELYASVTKPRTKVAEMTAVVSGRGLTPKKAGT